VLAFFGGREAGCEKHESHGDDAETHCYLLPRDLGIVLSAGNIRALSMRL
jgi:hypothetical protein